MTSLIPIVLFAYARPQHLRRTLSCLRIDQVPLIYAFSDGPKSSKYKETVNEVRKILRSIDWCEVVLEEHEYNLGLGKSILYGVSKVLEKHESLIVFEDDLVCVPGTYGYLCAALKHYKDEPKVMSVTGWTHPNVMPINVTDQPYFDGRAECWVWGTWARSWQGMDQDANKIMKECKKKGIDIFRYGADLPAMAEVELKKNIWAVRFLYLHLLRGGLCLRPPHSLVEHIGFDSMATNAKDGTGLINPPLKNCPEIPTNWPAPIEHLDCVRLWQLAYPKKSTLYSSSNVFLRIARKFQKGIDIKDLLKSFIPPFFMKIARRIYRTSKDKSSFINSTSPDYIEWEYIPEGWDYAKAHPEVRGWNVPEILERYKQKWSSFVAFMENNETLGISHESELTSNTDIKFHNINMTFAYVFTLAAHKKEKITMLDWGGGIGHYYLLAKTLLPKVQIEYHCKDVPQLAEYGAQLFPEHHFYPDDSCLKRTYDFVMASTSLQYVEDWQSLLSGLAKATKKYLYITGLPIVLNVPSFVFIQRPYSYGYNTEYLGWCLNKKEFLSCAERQGIKLIREFIVGDKPHIQFAPEQNEYRGFLFERTIKDSD
jgi:putative methyltransferase (TIGR04325 family)